MSIVNNLVIYGGEDFYVSAPTSACDTTSAASRLTRAKRKFLKRTVTVTDGRDRAKLTLLGTYVTSDFALSNDGHRGTFV